ncbi:S8/S53 family peptidase [Plesiocystis pacifica]|uniref:S8/S53 family peptidase n=1 Tax=Plesiocystis pacifica TaxID=191768 RepID=UPI0012FA98FC|nr:S8/S53 family peptidase [Plesiocystis pacifica]
MNTHKIAILALCSLGLAACEVGNDQAFEAFELAEFEGESHADDAGEQAASEELQAPAQAAETLAVDPFAVVDCIGANRLIGILDKAAPASCDPMTGGTAPLSADWIAHPLFESGSPGVQAIAGSAPGNLDRYCAYDYVGNPVINTSNASTIYGEVLDKIDIWGSMPITSVAADCRGQFAQGDLYDAPVSAAFEDSFMTNIGWDMGANALGAGTGRDAVDVAVVDTVSADAAAGQVTPHNAHGLFMTHIVDAITCPGGQTNCAGSTENVLAMPRDEWSSGPSWVEGGDHGTQGDLAMGVYQAVAEWLDRRDTLPNAPKRLVINLSVGWNRDLQNTEDLSKGPAQSLIAALEYARCQGALVVAAAGNNLDESCPGNQSGVLAPAAYQDMAALTELECDARGYDADPVWEASYPSHHATGWRPLVLAVGALDPFDAPTANARDGGMPLMAAYGQGALIDGKFDDPLTGSSVSSAVVAATMALMWSYRPELTPPEIILELYYSGWNTGMVADMPVGWPVARTSVCSALSAVCQGQANCPTNICTVAAPPAHGNLDVIETAVNGALAGATVDDHTQGASVAKTCDTPVGPTTTLSDPQPQTPICARCNLFVPPGGVLDDDALHMTIDDEYHNENITIVQLTTFDNADNETVFNLTPSTLTSLNGQPTPMDITRAYFEASDAVQATIEITLQNGTTQENDVTVIRL